jgi:peptidoglycan/xylan/chitin deacetylase (PgdA/CDA1 family)
MQLKVWILQMRSPVEGCRRFIRKITMKKEIARLRAENRILYRGNIHLPAIALTFDDGPDPHYTLQVLEILQQCRVKATFFLRWASSCGISPYHQTRV